MTQKIIDHNHKSRGFTLIEAVVATAVFVFVVSSVVGIYISTFQLDRKTRSQRAVTQNARFIMEFLAKEVSNGTIDYASYPSGTIPLSPDLYVDNQAHEVERFYFSGTDMVMTKNGSSTNLNSAAVKVTKLKFMISPSQNPYQVSKITNNQPYVTVVLELTANYGTNIKDSFKMNLQNTFTTRNYPSRQ